MNPYVVSVRALAGFQLELGFENGEYRLFDVKPYLSRGIFQQLRDLAVFQTARVVAGSVEWIGTSPLHSPALSFDTLYAEGVSIPESANLRLQI
jgi:hypothetical protein